MILYALLYTAAFVLFLIVALRGLRTRPGVIDLVALGLACWVLVPMIIAWQSAK